ncbi:MAG: class I SAM-dependent DNA methyltransferase, partial [Chroococcales cyanobacterium]
DDLRSQLEEAGDNRRKLLNLRQRIARIRVFDPACGSGNFLVIGYKEMRKIEAEINHRRGELERHSEIPLTNFRGIEIRHFAAEVARLALIIAEFQCDVLYRGPQLALLEFLPLKNDNWITCGNALRLDWLSLCPPTGTGVKVQREDLDLWGETRDEAEIDFENEGGETYICGNPPYLGSREQERQHKDDLQQLFDGKSTNWKALDYVAGWFFKAAEYELEAQALTAFVTTNSICQGQQVPLLWPMLFERGIEIFFAQTSFNWSNLASQNAGVTVIIVGLSKNFTERRRLFYVDHNGMVKEQTVSSINPYLVPGNYIHLIPSNRPLNGLPEMMKGNYPIDGGHLLLGLQEKKILGLTPEQEDKFIRPFLGSSEVIRGLQRYCIWIEKSDLQEAHKIGSIAQRIEAVRQMRIKSKKEATKRAAETPYCFGEIRQTGDEEYAITLPVHSSENRDYLPVALLRRPTIVYGSAFALYDAPLWNMALIASRLHLVWIATVCGKLKTDFRYSNTLGWNTFPVPTLTEQNKIDLTRCAEQILLAREHYFPATIADMYDPKRMDSEFPRVREAHDRNDEIIERIYIGRRFKNDTERLEKLFELYTKMTRQQTPGKKPAKRKKDK